MPADLEPLAVAAADGRGPLLDRPTACFGHSMGALLAFEFARQVRRLGQPSLTHLVVSARGAPQLARTEAPVHTLPDGRFIETLRQPFNAIPDAILAEPELLQVFVSMLRTDFRLLETYHDRDEPPLDCPILASGGAQDEWARPAELAAWQWQTRGAFKLEHFAAAFFICKRRCRNCSI